jgi:peptidoglycan/LPS O-acetylase OafA/YrhL
MDNSFWLNVWGQVHTWLQTIGAFVITGVCYYLVEHDSADWTWKGLIVAVASAVLTYGLTKNDHNKTAQAVEKAAVTGEVPGKEGN